GRSRPGAQPKVPARLDVASDADEHHRCHQRDFANESAASGPDRSVPRRDVVAIPNGAIVMKKQNRREFIQRTGCAAIGMAAASAGFKKLGLMNLYAQNAIAQSATAGGYKALVCIFLAGGNDGNNMVVPVDGGYAAYQAVRGPSGLAIGNNGGAA